MVSKDLRRTMQRQALKKNRERMQTPALAMNTLTITCPCGNVLLPDSVNCRKCGQTRQVILSSLESPELRAQLEKKHRKEKRKQDKFMAKTKHKETPQEVYQRERAEAELLASYATNFDGESYTVYDHRDGGNATRVDVV